MGIDVSMPVMLAPTGVQAVHPDGEVAVARAALARGLAMGLSSFASVPMEDVTAALPATLFQMYWMGTREDMARIVDRARHARVTGLILTLDWSFSHGRDWGSPRIPERVTPMTIVGFAPEILRRPRWSWAFASRRKVPDLAVPNLRVGDLPPPTFFGAYRQWMQTPPPSWSDIAWLREQWEGPFMVKGVWHPADARLAVDIGASAISVSNHGGNNLDGVPSPLRVLPIIVDECGQDIEIILDGGVRRGSDVVKALALGAHAVMIGRSYLWGLAAGGQAGVENVLDIIRDGIVATLVGLKRGSVEDVDVRDVLVPEGFLRDPRVSMNQSVPT
jgi:L-lactate dehydrogenase (cytochrome)/glycolate oxidase